MKKNFTKFLLALLVVGGGFQSCKKANLSHSEETLNYADKTIVNGRFVFSSKQSISEIMGLCRL